MFLRQIASLNSYDLSIVCIGFSILIKIHYSHFLHSVIAIYSRQREIQINARHIFDLFLEFHVRTTSDLVFLVVKRNPECSSRRTCSIVANVTPTRWRSFPKPRENRNSSSTVSCHTRKLCCRRGTSVNVRTDSKFVFPVWSFYLISLFHDHYLMKVARN